MLIHNNNYRGPLIMNYRVVSVVIENVDFQCFRSLWSDPSYIRRKLLYRISLTMKWITLNDLEWPFNRGPQRNA